MFGYIIEMPIGNILGSAEATDLIAYIVALHKFAVILAAILAVIFMMIGGFMWLASAGNSGMVSTGQNFIKGSIIGLILTLFSWYILYAINPNLVKLSIKQPTITIPWCCQDNTTGVYSLSDETNPQSCPNDSTEVNNSLCDQLLVCCQSTNTNKYFTSLLSCPPKSIAAADNSFCDSQNCIKNNNCTLGQQCLTDEDCYQTAPQCVQDALATDIGTAITFNFCRTGQIGSPCVSKYDCNQNLYCNDQIFSSTQWTCQESKK